MKPRSPSNRALAMVIDDLVNWCGFAVRLAIPFCVVLLLAILIGASMSHPRLIARIAMAGIIAVAALFFVRLIEENRRE